MRFLWIIHTVVKEKKAGPLTKGSAELHSGVHGAHASGEGVRDDIHGSGGLELGEDVREGREKGKEVDRGTNRGNIASRLV